MTSTMVVGGRYSLDREIGRGGAGAVYMAHDQVLGRTVAIKRIGAPPGGADPDLQRAEREAQLAARVNHPHVVAVFDLVEDDDQQWLVMEHVEGTDMARQIRERGPLGPDEVAAALAQVADALAAAHDAGIVHRDVKPSNILVSQSGSVKLSDFGIARAQADAVLTQTGLVTGSPAYLSPEVASGQLATAPSDVWSLGATAYHALAGHPPYDVSDNLMGALYRIVHEDPPRLRSAGWLAPLLETMMSKDPADRPSMRDVADYLRAGPGMGAVPEAAGVGAGAAPAAVVAAAGSGTAAHGGESTEVLRPVDDPVLPHDDGTRVAAPPPSAPADDDRRRDRKVVPLVVAAVVVALLLGLGVLLFLPDPQDDEAVDPPTAGQSSRDRGQQPSESPSESESQDPRQPTEADLEDFANSYVSTAAGDPRAGFDMLTPAYQQASGGFSGYNGFWGGVSNASIDRVTGDPDSLTVSYTYTYTYDGATRTENVQLQLEQTPDGGLLVAGA